MAKSGVYTCDQLKHQRFVQPLAFGTRVFYTRYDRKALVIMIQYKSVDRMIAIEIMN